MLKRLGCGLNRFLGHETGMAAIEMAFIFPVMLILYFGMVDVTNLLSANRKITLAASTMADLITQEAGATSIANLNGFYKAVRPIMDPFPTDNVGIQIYNYRIVNNVVTRIWREGTGPSCGPAPQGTEVSSLDKLMTDGNDILIARVCIGLTTITGSIIGTSDFTLDKSNFSLQDQIALRPRQSAKIDCPTCKPN